MRENKRKRLLARGWRVGSAKDFLGLTDQEAAYIELKLRLAASLLECRTSRFDVGARRRSTRRNDETQRSTCRQYKFSHRILAFSQTVLVLADTAMRVPLRMRRGVAPHSVLVGVVLDRRSGCAH